jgi:hypothetical protein
MNYSANKMAAKHCLSAQCIVVDIVPLILIILNIVPTEKVDGLKKIFLQFSH